MLPIKDTIPRRNPPIATWVIIFLNCFVFLLELTMSPYSLQQTFYLFGIVPAPLLDFANHASLLFIGH